MARTLIGVLGATSLVGDSLLASETKETLTADVQFVAFSRRPVGRDLQDKRGVIWRSLRDRVLQTDTQSIEFWICLAPIWVLPEYFSLLQSYGASRVVVLSSTSRFTKSQSPDPAERGIAASLVAGETQLIDWAEAQGMVWIILRPTLIYGYGRDKNISSIASFIHRFRFFPLSGTANGLRQPIHASDVATACLQALMHSELVNRSYNISGAETLTYSEMVRRVFDAIGKKPRLLHVPPMAFHLVVALSRLIPRFRYVSLGMVERMNQDLIFDHSDAVRDFSFHPGPFYLHSRDVS